MTLRSHMMTSASAAGGRRAKAAAALAAVVAWVGGSANAADLGGADCCADLEERVLELEQFAARKGNRKVSLRMSGQISQAVLAFDDGVEKQAYQVQNSNSSSRLRFDGVAKLTSDLRAGYVIELNIGTASSAGVSQTSDESGTGTPTVRQSAWFIDSRRLGSITVGQSSPATDDIIGYNLGGTSLANWSDVSLFGGNLALRDSRTGVLNNGATGSTISLRWSRLFPELDTGLANVVRYDSPVLFQAFTISAAWGEDDIWDVALRGAFRGNGFRLAFGVGYFQSGDENSDTFGWPRGGDAEPNGGSTTIREIKGSGSLSHEPTGLFVSGAYLNRSFSGSDLGASTFACFTSPDAVALRANTGLACANRPDLDYFSVTAGIKTSPFSFGATTLYGEYARSSGAVTGLNVSVDSAFAGDIDQVTGSTAEIWGLGIVQSVDAAAMDLFIAYRRLSADVRGFESSGGAVSAPLEDADLVMAGSRIRF